MNERIQGGRWPLIDPKFPGIIHGGDYNPEQWLDVPGVIDEDFRLMKLAGVNSASVGIFAWSAIEPEEGRFEFGWLDDIMDRLHENGSRAVLATPSGARPAWLSKKYPEVLRVNCQDIRNLHGGRHNHCLTSPVYREKCRTVNRKLAERYAKHPALAFWHVSNEYSGECFCPLCQEAFRNWLRKRYDNDLGKVNKAWWTSFWSHTYDSWDEIEPPSWRGETCVHGLNLDWKRFITDQTIDFYMDESSPLREITPLVPRTVNMMGTFPGLDYWKFAEKCDLVSWDNYPAWHADFASEEAIAASTSFVHDIYRCLKGGKPFMLMESTPSQVNWHSTCKLKKPGMHATSSLQAVAHGADSVQYFQWRKSRGSSEKLHGAVVDHVGNERTRVFGEVAELGKNLEKLACVAGARSEAKVGLVYDWENRWAIEDLQGLTKDRRQYQETCEAFYKPFWKRGITVDVIREECDFSSYKILVAPMLYMLKPGVAERLAAFVEAGGTLVCTYLTGMVNESDLCFLGGMPGDGLSKTLGIRAEEVDNLFPSDANEAVIQGGTDLGLKGRYRLHTICELIHAEGAEVIATYGSDFYAHRPVITRNRAGKGLAYYVAARSGDDLVDALMSGIIGEAGLEGAAALAACAKKPLPDAVTIQRRFSGDREFLFLLNFGSKDATVDLGNGRFADLLAEGQEAAEIKGKVTLEPFGNRVIERLA